LNCDKSINLLQNNDAIIDQSLTYHISSDSQYFCAQYSYHDILEKLRSFKYLYIIAALLIGLIECYFGYYFFKPTIFLVDTIVTIRLDL